MSTNGEPFDENELYQQFPEGREGGYGTEHGFNTYVRLNDPSLFDPAALERSPALRAFAESGDAFSISFAQFKSSTRESEWSLHKPNLTLDAVQQRRKGVLPARLDIDGAVEKYPGPDLARISTFIINHDRTMARWKQSVILVEDGAQAAQMIYKHPPEEDPDPDPAAE